MKNLRLFLLFGFLKLISQPVVSVQQDSEVIESIFQLEFSAATRQAELIEGEGRYPLFSYLVQIISNAGQSPETDAGVIDKLEDFETSGTATIIHLVSGAYLLYNAPDNQEAYSVISEAISQARTRGEVHLEKLGYFLLLELYNMEIVQSSESYLDHINRYKKLADSPFEKAWYHIHYLAYITKAIDLENGEQLFTRALSDFEKLIEKNRLNDKVMSYYFFNKAIFGRVMGQYDTARMAYLAVIELSKSHSFLEYLKFSSFIHLADISSKERRFEEAKSLLDSAKLYTNDSDRIRSQYILSRYSALYFYSEIGDYKKAYTLLDSSTFYERKLDFRQNTLKISELNVKLKTAQKERDLAENKLILIGRTNWLWAVAVLSMLLAILLIGLLWSLRKIKEKNKKIENLMRELHHRVKNNLQVISSLLGLQSMKLKDVAAQKAIAEGKERIRAMSLIHQRLYQNDEVSSLNIREYMINLVTELINSYGFGQKIRFHCEVPSINMNADTSLPLGLIVNELVSNSLKHAFSNVEEPIIEVKLDAHGENQYMLTVGDNGSGMPAEYGVEESTSFGMKLVHLLIKQLGGNLTFEARYGTRFEIRFNAVK